MAASPGPSPPTAFRFALARAVLRLRSRDDRAAASRPVPNGGALALCEALGLAGGGGGEHAPAWVGGSLESAGGPLERCLLQLSRACADVAAGEPGAIGNAALAALGLCMRDAGDREALGKAMRLLLQVLEDGGCGRGAQHQAAVLNLGAGLLEICMHPLRASWPSEGCSRSPLAPGVPQPGATAMPQMRLDGDMPHAQPPSPPAPEAKARAAWCLSRILNEAPRDHSESLLLLVASSVLAAADEAADPEAPPLAPRRLRALSALPTALEVLRGGARRVFALPPGAKRGNEQVAVLSATVDICCSRLPSFRARPRAQHVPLDLLWTEIDRTRGAVVATLREAAAAAGSGGPSGGLGSSGELQLLRTPGLEVGLVRRLESRASGLALR